MSERTLWNRSLWNQLSLLSLLTFSLGWLAAPASATPTSSFYSVDFIETSDAVKGDVVVVGDAVFVGVGDFGAGAQSVVRIDGDGETVIATGFNSLAGFAYDAANDELLVGDNGFSTGAATGDTVYAIPDPFGSPTTPASASSLALFADESFPGVSDLVLDPTDPSGDTLLIGDASADFPPNGLVWEAVISSDTTGSVVTGLEFTAGLAVSGNVLFYSDALLSDFSGRIFSLDLSDPMASPMDVASLPDGVFDIEFAPDGSLFASSGGGLVDVGDGSISSLASGFGFTGGFDVAADGSIYVIDGAPLAGEENRVWVLTEIPEPGTGLLLGLAGGWLVLRRRAV